MATVHEFSVAMTCGGCSGAVTRILKRMDGVSDIQCDLETQRVLVTSTLDADTLLAAIKKAGKETSYVGVKQ